MFFKWKYLFYMNDSIYAIKKQIKNERRKQNLSEKNIKLVIAEKPSVAQSFAMRLFHRMMNCVISFQQTYVIKSWEPSNVPILSNYKILLPLDICFGLIYH